MTVAAPLRYEDVTPEWVTAALRDSWPEVEVTAVRRGPVFGYKQNKFRVEVDYGAGGDGLANTYIVKGNFPGQDDPATGSAWAMASELRSLRDIVPRVAAPRGPTWHHISVADDASAIIMEDLAPKGATFFDAFHTLDFGQAMGFMDAFARMHASSWNSPMFAAGASLGPGSLAWENRRMVNDVYFPSFFVPENWQAYVELPRGRALPNAFQDLDRARNAWAAMWKLLGTSAMVVIHGDEHLGNLYVAADGTPGVIDWVARPEHWPLGIGYFMLCALDVVDRRDWERALLAHYVTRLAAYGVRDGPSFEEAWYYYRCVSFYPVMTWLNNSGAWQPEAINTANAVRAATAAIDHDSLRLLGV